MNVEEMLSRELLPLCQECGGKCDIDEDGCCLECGCTAVTGASLGAAAIATALTAAVEAEREECAKAVEDIEVITYKHGGMVYDDGAGSMNAAAAAIRARGGE
jgi:hypothetical protein